MPSINQFIATNGYIPFPPEYDAQLVASTIEELATNEKTKGTQLFKRFYENDRALFDEFRALNASEKLTKTAAFHEVGERVQGKLRYLENILTEKMFKRDTDKTVTAFYDHVRLFFPYYDQIGME